MRFCLAVTALGLLTVSAAHAEPLKVVASFSVLGDFVQRVGGPDVSVTTLVGPNGDTHTYEPKPSDAEAIAKADLVVVNGLGLDKWMGRLESSAEYKGPTAVATVAVTPLHSDEEGTDPHAWQSVANAVLYTQAIDEALEKTDPAHAAAYHQRAADYEGELNMLDNAVKAAFVTIPEDKRVVITTHDAFGYYGHEFGVTFLAPEGLSTESEADAKGVAALIDQIQRDHVKAVFIENMTDPRLVQQVAKDSGVDISGELFSDALSPPDGPASTYVDMVRYNTKTLASAMQDQPETK